jgi:cellulose synthase operon protein C
MLEWIVGYAGSTALDKILKTIWGPNLDKALLQQVTEWMEQLPSEQSVSTPEALFPAQKPDEDLQDRPSLLEIRRLLGSSNLPSEDLWHRALVEQWHSVRKLSGELQAFFQCDPNVASEQLSSLAKRLHVTCIQQPDLFQPKTIALLGEIAGLSTQLDSKADAIADGIQVLGTELDKHQKEFLSKIDDTPHTVYAALDPRLANIEAMLGNITALQSDSERKVETAIDRQIDAYVDLMSTDPKTSLNLLNQLQSQLGLEATQRIRFRVNANIAACHFELGQEELAADQFIESYDLDPTHANAASNKALGFLIKKNIAELKKFALDALQENPENAILAGYLVQGLAYDNSIEAPLDLLPDQLRDHPHVQVSYVRWLMDRGTPGQWRDAAIAAYENKPDTEGLAEYYANAMLDIVLEQTGFESGLTLDEQQTSIISSCAEIYEEAWNEIREHPSSQRLRTISIPLNLMLAYRLLNRGDEAIRIGAEALTAFPDSEDVKRRNAATLLEYGYDDKSRELIANLPLNADTVMMRLNLYLGAQQWSEVDQLVSTNLELFPEAEKAIAVTAQIVAKVELAEAKEREGILETCKGNNEDDPRVNMLIARSARQNGFDDLSEHFFQIGLSVLDSSDTRFADRVTVAQEAIARDEPGIAARVLYGHISTTYDSTELRMLARAIAHEFPIRSRAEAFFASLPGKVRNLPFYKHAEGTYHLNRGAPNDAVPCFQESLAQDRTLPDLMGLIIAFLRSDNEEAVRSLLEDPSLDELPGAPIDRLNFCHILLDFGFADRSICLGYQTVLESPDQSDVVMKFIGLTLKPSSALTVLNPIYVGPGVWVRMSEDNGADYSALVGEVADRPWGQAVSIENTFVSGALGLGLGETFEHTTALGLTEKWTIKEIKPNWLHAAQYLGATFNQRFPEARGFASVSMKEGDIQPTLDQVKRTSKAHEERLEFYTSHDIPIAIAAGENSSGAIGFAEYVASWDKDIKTCTGNELERDAALEAIEVNEKRGAVIDAFTAWTASELNILEVLQRQLGPLSIPSTELDLIRSIVSERGADLKGESMSLSFRNGQFYRTILTEDQRAKDIEVLKERLKHIELFCSEEATVLPDTLPEPVERLISVTSGRLIAPVVLANPDRLLLSDDMALRQIGSTFFDTKGVWLQAALLSAFSEGAMSLEEYCDALVLLSAKRHDFVSVNASILHSVYERDGSHSLIRLQAICTYVGSAHADARSHLTLAAAFLNQIWTEARVENLKVFRATSIVLRSLIIRNRGEEWATWAAGLFPMLTRGAQKYFIGWCKGHFLPLEPINDALNSVNQQNVR